MLHRQAQISSRLEQSKLQQQASSNHQALSLSDSELEKNILLKNERAMALLQQGKKASALLLLRESEKILMDCLAHSQKNPLINRLTGLTLNNLGCYFRKDGKLNVALKKLFAALAIEVVSQECDYPSIAGTHLNICAIFSSLNKHHEAARHANAALSLIQQVKETQKNESNRNRSQSRSSSNSRNSNHPRSNSSNSCSHKEDQLTEQKAPDDSYLIKTEVVSYYNLGIELEHLKEYSSSLSIFSKGLLLAKDSLGQDNPLHRKLRESVKRLQDLAADKRDRRQAPSHQNIAPTSNIAENPLLKQFHPHEWSFYLPKEFFAGENNPYLQLSQDQIVPHQSQHPDNLYHLKNNINQTSNNKSKSEATTLIHKQHRPKAISFEDEIIKPQQEVEKLQPIEELNDGLSRNNCSRLESEESSTCNYLDEHIEDENENYTSQFLRQIDVNLVQQQPDKQKSSNNNSEQSKASQSNRSQGQNHQGNHNNTNHSISNISMNSHHQQQNIRLAVNLESRTTKSNQAFDSSNNHGVIHHNSTSNTSNKENAIIVKQNVTTNENSSSSRTGGKQSSELLPLQGYLETKLSKRRNIICTTEFADVGCVTSTDIPNSDSSHPASIDVHRLVSQQQHPSVQLPTSVLCNVQNSVSSQQNSNSTCTSNIVINRKQSQKRQQWRSTSTVGSSYSNQRNQSVMTQESNEGSRNQYHVNVKNVAASIDQQCDKNEYDNDNDDYDDDSSMIMIPAATTPLSIVNSGINQELIPSVVDCNTYCTVGIPQRSKNSKGSVRLPFIAKVPQQKQQSQQKESIVLSNQDVSVDKKVRQQGEHHIAIADAVKRAQMIPLLDSTLKETVFASLLRKMQKPRKDKANNGLSGNESIPQLNDLILLQESEYHQITSEFSQQETADFELAHQIKSNLHSKNFSSTPSDWQARSKTQRSVTSIGNESKRSSTRDRIQLRDLVTFEPLPLTMNNNQFEDKSVLVSLGTGGASNLNSTTSHRSRKSNGVRQSSSSLSNNNFSNQNHNNNIVTETTQSSKGNTKHIFNQGANYMLLPDSKIPAVVQNRINPLQMREDTPQQLPIKLLEQPRSRN